MMPKTLLLFLTIVLCAPVYAQPEPFLDVLFTSNPGEEPVGLFSHSDLIRNLDANGDGTADLVMTSNDAQGVLMEILVLDVATNETLFQIRDVQTTLNLSGQDFYRFHSFADPDGDGVQDALFYSDREVVVGVVNDADFDIWQRGFNPNGDSVMFFYGTTAFTNDGSEELVIGYRDEDVVRVWGNAGNDNRAAR